MALTPREINLQSNTDVLGYIQEQNARVDAQAKAEGWQFWTLMSESLAEEHTNVYDLELMFAMGTYSDVHKEKFGIRPHGYGDWTLTEVESMIEELASYEEDSADILAEEVREEYWAQCDAEEEAARNLEMQRRRDEEEDALWDLQDEFELA